MGVESWALKYEELHEKRYRQSLKVVKRFCEPGKDILEVGAAPFQLTNMLSNEGYSVTGLDLEPERRMDYIEEKDLDIRKCNIEVEEFPIDSQYSLVLMTEVFEHLRIDPLGVIQKCYDATEEGGYFILSTPNLYSVHNIINFLLGRGVVDPLQEFGKIEKLGHMGHVNEYSKSQMVELIENKGFDVVETQFHNFEMDNGKKSAICRAITPIFPRLKEFQMIIARK